MAIEPITLPDGRKIGPGEPCFIVAEIGQNHNGRRDTALRLMKAAHDAGVDAVKFCKRHIPSDLTREAHEQPYDNPHSFGATYGEHREALEFGAAEYRHLKDRMDYNEWPEVLFSTVCDIQSAVDINVWLDPPMYKIASRDLDNLPLIDRVAQFGKPMILSTGMGTVGMTNQALSTIRAHHNQVIVLYCVSEYPTPLEHIDLGVLPIMEDLHQCPIGFSDHTAGIVASQAAALLGFAMIEKHITLARAMKGTDHAGSLEPDGLNRLVKNIQAGEVLRTSLTNQQHKDRRPALDASRRKLGRSIVAVDRICCGEIITEDKLCLKSPGTGFQWCERGSLIGRVAERTIEADTLITLMDTGLTAPVPILQPVESK